MSFSNITVYYKSMDLLRKSLNLVLKKGTSATNKLNHPSSSWLSVRVHAWSTLAELWRASSRRSPSISFTGRWNTNETRSLQTSELWRGEHLQAALCPILVPMSLNYCPISIPVASWCALTWWPEESTSPMSTGCSSTIPPAVPGELQKQCLCLLLGGCFMLLLWYLLLSLFRLHMSVYQWNLQVGMIIITSSFISFV